MSNRDKDKAKYDTVSVRKVCVEILYSIVISGDINDKDMIRTKKRCDYPRTEKRKHEIVNVRQLSSPIKRIYITFALLLF